MGPPRVVHERLIATIKTPAGKFFNPYASSWNPASSLIVSPDSRHVAFVIEKSGGWAVVVDQVEGPRYDAIYKGAFGFSPDSQHFGYIGAVGSQMFYVIDGKEQARFELVGNLTFSADGRHSAYAAKSAGQTYLVRDGLSYRVNGDWASGPVLSPDGQHVIYSICNERKCTLFTDQTPGPVYDLILPELMRLSPDGKHLAYMASSSVTWSESGLVIGQRFMVIDGVAQKPCSTMSEAIFSANSKHVGYAAELQGRHLLVIDGQEQRSYPRLGHGRFTFSPDGSRVAYIAQPQGSTKWAIVVDGQEYVHDDIIDMDFSADSRHFAYIARDGDVCYAFIDGRRGRPHRRYSKPLLEPIPAIIAGAICLSPGGSHFAFWEPWSVLIDDLRGGKEGLILGLIQFDTNHRLHYIQLRNKDVLTQEIYVVEEEISE